MTLSVAQCLVLTVDTCSASVLGFWKNFTHFLRRRGLGFWRFSPAEWRSMLSQCFALSPCTRCSPLEYRHHFYELTSWILCDDVGHFSCSVRIFRTLPLGVECPVLLPINPQGLWTYAFRLKDRVKNNHNNNNNAIWGGSVLTGEELPPHSGELKHALSQAGGPTQSQLSRPMSSRHHISVEHRLRKKQLNSDTNASNKTCLK